MPEQNPLDKMATELAEWADAISTRIADGVKGGFNAPGAAQLSERQKMAFYKSQLFNPDGSTNDAGRAQVMQRLGAAGFAEVYQDVTRAHPELVPPEIPQGSMLQPTEVPGVSEVVPAPPIEDLVPTGVPGVAEVRNS